MKSTDALRDIISKQGRSQRSVALDMGLSPQALASRLSEGSNMRTKTLSEVSDALGYRIMLVPNDVDTVGYRIDE